VREGLTKSQFFLATRAPAAPALRFPPIKKMNDQPAHAITKLAEGAPTDHPSAKPSQSERLNDFSRPQARAQGSAGRQSAKDRPQPPNDDHKEHKE